MIGLLLDLDRGTLTSYDCGDGKKMVICTGLRGHFCWAASPCSCTVKMEKAPIPADALS